MKHSIFKKAWALVLMLLTLATANADVWQRVTSVDDLLQGGTCIIGYEATANSGVIVPMKNTGTATLNAQGYIYSGTTASTVISNGQTINMDSVSETSGYEVTIAPSTTVTGAITIKCGNNFVGHPASSGNVVKLYSSETSETSLTPTMQDNSVFKLALSDKSCLQYNNNNGSLRFSFYSGTQKNVVIYKKVVDGTKPTPTLSFPQSEYTTYVDALYTLPRATTSSDATITYSMEENDHSLFDDNAHTFTSDAVGNYTLTASVAETDTYAATTATTTIKVVAQQATTDGDVALVFQKNGVYYATTTTLNSRAGFPFTEVTVVNGKVVADDPQSITWHMESAGEGKVYLTTPNGSYLAYANNTSDKTKAKLTTTKNALDVKDDHFYGSSNRVLSATTGNINNVDRVAFFSETNLGGGIYFAVSAMPFANATYTRDVVEGDYGTICLPSSVTAADRYGATFYNVSSVQANGTTLMLTEETGTLEAGKPYLFLATGSQVGCIYTANTEVDTSVPNGLLVGTLTELTNLSVPHSYVLQKQDDVLAFYRVENTLPTVSANHAYLVYEAPNGEEVKALSFATATGLDIVRPVSTSHKIYNLQGQRVSLPAKGLYIINGKKVVR